MAASRLPHLAVPETAHSLADVEAAAGPGWSEIAAATRFAAQERCEACEAETKLGIFPVWSFEDSSRRQRLRGLIALCDACALAAHDITSTSGQTLSRFAELNGWTPREARAVLSKAMRDFDRRSRISWAVEFGVILEVRPPDPAP